MTRSLLPTPDDTDLKTERLGLDRLQMAVEQHENRLDTSDALLNVTPGTVSASKAVVVDASKIISGLLFPKTARTVTADGTGTGTIAAGAGQLQVIVVTSDDANKILVLPAPVVGIIIVIINGTTGYELRSSDPATIGINGGTGAGAESEIPASTTAILICETATNWKGFQMSSAAGTLAAVEVAA